MALRGCLFVAQAQGFRAELACTQSANHKQTQLQHHMLPPMLREPHLPLLVLRQGPSDPLPELRSRSASEVHPPNPASVGPSLRGPTRPGRPPRRGPPRPNPTGAAPALTTGEVQADRGGSSAEDRRSPSGRRRLRAADVCGPGPPERPPRRGPARSIRPTGPRRAGRIRSGPTDAAFETPPPRPGARPSSAKAAQPWPGPLIEPPATPLRARGSPHLDRSARTARRARSAASAPRAASAAAGGVPGSPGRPERPPRCRSR